MDTLLGKPFDKGKREAQDAIETEVTGVKKQRVEEKMGEIETDTVEDKEKVEADTSCSEPEQWLKVDVSSGNGLIVSVLEDKSNVLVEDAGAAEKEPAVMAERHKVVQSKKDESNYDSDSCFQDETSLAQDITATIRAPASLIEEDPAAPLMKKDDCCSKDETISDEDVTGANLSPPALSIPISLVSIKKIDDSLTDEFTYALDVNGATAKKAPAATMETGPVVDWEKKDEDNEMSHEVAAENIPSVFTKKEDESNDELELDNETSSSDDEAQTPATPPEQTTGGKTLFVGNLSFSIEREDVEQFFKDAGEIVNIRFGMNTDETFKGYGYVEFSSAEAAEKALHELNGKELLRRRVRLDFVRERGTFNPHSGCQDRDSFQKEGKCTVFVRGFNKADCLDEIRRSLEVHFGSCGEISRVTVPKDQDGCARGIAFIEFKDRNAFNLALALNGSEFQEGMLSVKEATSRSDSQDMAGSGRGYGRYGGRYSWRDFSGRSGWCGFGGRNDRQDFNGRSAYEAGGGRSDWRDFSGRRGDWRDLSGRRGVHEAGGGRGDWRDFGGRRGDWRDLSGRRGVNEAGGGRGDWRRGFSGRGFCRTGNWFGAGVWHKNSGQRGGPSNYFNGRQGILGPGVWFGGGGRGPGTSVEPSVAAPAYGNNTSVHNEDHMEDQM